VARAGWVRYGRHVTVWLVKEELGMVRQAWRGAVGLVEVRFGEDKQGKRGKARSGWIWKGVAGEARLGEAR
jgi:hypothetical protein